MGNPCSAVLVAWQIGSMEAAAAERQFIEPEDIFIAIGSILLIRSFLDQNGFHVQPADLAFWAIPTAVCAFVIHGSRLLLLDRSLKAGNVVEEAGKR